MARKKPIAQPVTHSPSLTGIVLKAGLTIAIAVGLISLLIWIGNRAGSSVADLPRYHVSVSSIVVEPPSGVERSTFLAEVRAAGGLPETVSAVSAETPGLIAAAFAAHPWVAKVTQFSVKSDRSIHVELSFRTPILAVPMMGTPNVRLVDKDGVLLPPAPIPDGVAVLRVDNPRPAGTAGQVMTDEVVKRAAELVEIYKSTKPRLIEKIKTGWRLTPASGTPLLVSW